jgi:hypothetical protein
VANVTINVSGVSALRYLLTANNTYYFSNGTDGQKLRLTFVQDATGSRTVTSGNCPGIMQPNGTANSDSTQELIYDAAVNAWSQVPQGSAPGTLAFTTYTTNTTFAWSKGTVALSGASAITLTITNPVSGPPGTGNDGEVMIFVVTSAQTHKVTMGTTQSINGSSTSAQFAGAIGNTLSLQAWGGKVYITAVQGTLTLS